LEQAGIHWVDKEQVDHTGSGMVDFAANIEAGHILKVPFEATTFKGIPFNSAFDLKMDIKATHKPSNSELVEAVDIAAAKLVVQLEVNSGK
jgi:hypothetical protein